MQNNINILNIIIYVIIAVVRKEKRDFKCLNLLCDYTSKNIPLVNGECRYQMIQSLASLSGGLLALSQQLLFKEGCEILSIFYFNI